jgi:hypothetical protein
MCLPAEAGIASWFLALEWTLILRGRGDGRKKKKVSRELGIDPVGASFVKKRYSLPLLNELAHALPAVMVSCKPFRTLGADKQTTLFLAKEVS